MATGKFTKKRLVKTSFVLVLSVGMILTLRGQFSNSAAYAEEAPQPDAASFAVPAREFESLIEAPEDPVETEWVQGDYSRFRHNIREHSSLSCLMCHRRDTNAATIRRPGHTPCIGCHVQQFNEPASSKMCTICHTNVGSANPPVKRFPPLRSFNVKFSHVVHNRRGATPRQGCAACHTPLQRGAALSIPDGISAHTTCFQCHTNRARVGGRDISSCSTCHSLGRPPGPPATGSRAFRIGFTHAGHRSMSCNECHTVRAGTRGNQSTAPAIAMHFATGRAQSCATCHDGKRAFGDSDFNNCSKCHQGNRFSF